MSDSEEVKDLKAEIKGLRHELGSTKGLLTQSRRKELDPTKAEKWIGICKGVINGNVDRQGLREIFEELGG